MHGALLRCVASLLLLLLHRCSAPSTTTTACERREAAVHPAEVAQQLRSYGLCAHSRPRAGTSDALLAARVAEVGGAELVLLPRASADCSALDRMLRLARCSPYSGEMVHDAAGAAVPVAVLRSALSADQFRGIDGLATAGGSATLGFELGAAAQSALVLHLSPEGATACDALSAATANVLRSYRRSGILPVLGLRAVSLSGGASRACWDRAAARLGQAFNGTSIGLTQRGHKGAEHLLSAVFVPTALRERVSVDRTGPLCLRAWCVEGGATHAASATDSGGASFFAKLALDMVAMLALMGAMWTFVHLSRQAACWGNALLAQKARRAVQYTTCWYLVSITLTMYNKWLFTQWAGVGFRFPVFITMLHMFVKFCLARAALALGFGRGDGSDAGIRLGQAAGGQRAKAPPRPSRAQQQQMYWRKAVPVGLLTGIDVCLSNISFLYVSVTFYTIVKSSTPMFTLVLSVACGLQQCSGSLVGSVLLLCSGVALASYGETQFSALGFCLVLGAAACGALRWVVTQQLLHSGGANAPPSMTPLETTYAIAPASICALVLPFLWLEYRQLSESCFRSSAGSLLSTVAVVMVGGFLAFGLILSEFYLVRETSSLSLSVAGIFKELIIIVFAISMFGDRLTFVNSCGLLLTVAGIAFYNVLKLRTNRQAAAAAAPPDRQGEHRGLVGELSDEEL